MQRLLPASLAVPASAGAAVTPESPSVSSKAGAIESFEVVAGPQPVVATAPAHTNSRYNLVVIFMERTLALRGGGCESALR